ncbi:MAG: pyridoxal phosphate-dependent decarboxylase family protein [Elainellaceae cyanobacterium]
MSHSDSSFLPNDGLARAVELLRQDHPEKVELPQTFPEQGLGELGTLEQLAPYVLGDAARLDAPHAIAHMDPPTPWITWAMALWNARLNQNLLHRSTAPFATEAERLVLEWLTPFFGMGGGHLCSGSTLANLTALWAARDAKGVKRIVASKAAHISIEKAARILGLPYEQVSIDAAGQIDAERLGNLADAALVLIAGTTTTGSVDPLELAGQAAWTHVDAAWGGPLRLSSTHAHLLAGVEAADSITISAHKWLFQPKDSALILFREPDFVREAISFGSSYLADPNVGVQGSRGAAAVPLLATLMAWGRLGMAERVDQTMTMATRLAERLSEREDIELWGKPKTGITVFRSRTCATAEIHRRLPEGMLSVCRVHNQSWLRSVAANPLANIDDILTAIDAAIAVSR